MKNLRKLGLNNWLQSQLSNSELRKLQGQGSTPFCYAGCTPSESAALAKKVEISYPITAPPLPPEPVKPPDTDINIDIELP